MPVVTSTVAAVRHPEQPVQSQLLVPASTTEGR